MSEPRTAAEAFIAGLGDDANVDLNAKCVIYLILCSVNGKGYVGQTRKQAGGRYRGHQLSAKDDHCSFIFANAMRKHGIENFSFYVIEICGSIAELNARETYWIDKLETRSATGYNLTSGGNAPEWVAPEVGAKISVAKQGQKFSDEHRSNLSKALTGRKISEEHRANTAAGLRGIKRSPEARAAISRGKRKKGTSDLARETSAANLRKTLDNPAVIKRLLATRQNRMWITNDVNSRKIYKTEAIPDGWRKGQAKSKKSRKPYSAEAIHNMSEAARNRPKRGSPSEETRKKQSESVKRYWAQRRDK